MSYIKKTLDNGLRIMLVPLKDTETVTVMVLVETGSEYETEEKNGISHFLEHMAFKGTERRPHSSVINYELDSLGSQSNAFTNNEYTGYYAKAHAKHTHQLIDIISDIYLHSTFPDEEIQKEKGVVIEEINMYEDRPDHKVWEILESAMYPHLPAGRPILGTKKTVSAFTRQDLVEYHREHYKAESTLVVVSGKIDEEKVTEEIKKAFSDISAGHHAQKQKNVYVQNKPLCVVHNRKVDQTHLVLAYRSFDRYDARVYPASLLSTILGKGMSSRLFAKMREELGICYYIHTSHQLSTDRGMFALSAGVSSARLEEGVKGIIEELKKIINEQVTDQELRKAKDFKIGNLFLNLESSDQYADFYGFQEIAHDGLFTPQQIVEKIEAVTAEEIMKVARDIFMSPPTLALVGPHEDIESHYESLITI